MKGKIKWIILALVVIVIAIVVAVIIYNEAQFNYNIEEIKEYNYFALTKDRKNGSN